MNIDSELSKEFLLIMESFKNDFCGDLDYWNSLIKNFLIKL